VAPRRLEVSETAKPEAQAFPPGSPAARGEGYSMNETATKTGARIAAAQAM